jgi:hypothetical protein
MLVALVLAAAFAQEAPADAPRRVRGLANGRLSLVRRVISDAELIRAIATRNKVAESPADVKRKDDDWQRDPELPLRREIVANECAARLKTIVQEDPAISEAYLMDNRGALVCSIADVSDYWQGDEPSFLRTFGQGQFLFVGDPAPETGTGAWTVPISMVVLDGPTKIGAATLTLRVSPEMLAPPPTPTPLPPFPPPEEAPAATPTPPPVP